MAKIVAVYTGQGLSGPLQAVFKEKLPGDEFYNIIDDSIIKEVVGAGFVTKSAARRLTQYFLIAQEMGADVIISTCSSVREVVAMAQPYVDKPIISIDDLMGDEAIKNFSRVAVIATLPSTLVPTIQMLKDKAAAAGKDVQVVDGLAAGAYDALVSGKPEEHDRLILETAQKLADQVDGFVLAQGSMGRMQAALAQASGKPVLASPPLCAQQVAEYLEKNR